MPGPKASQPAQLYLGAMSGTSLDGIDIVLVDMAADTAGRPATIAHHHLPYSDETRQALQHLCEAALIEPEQLMAADRNIGLLTAECVNQLLNDKGLLAADIAAIGSHGQTVRHVPPKQTGSTATNAGFTLQIGDPNTIAAHTGIAVVADFRRANLAHGGQGAPLAPAFHAAAFGSALDSIAKTAGVAVVNVGGMANITVLQTGQPVRGFDCGPGNVLMDGWIGRHRQQRFDAGGAWAASGVVNPELLKTLLAHEFFSRAAPKSTGREEFNMAWLDTQLKKHPSIAPADVQASLLELSARGISDTLTNIDGLAKDGVSAVSVCGGGAYNEFLLKRLAELLPSCAVNSTQSLGIAPELVECCAFAWFAQQTLHKQAVATCEFTGGARDTILGGVYYG